MTGIASYTVNETGRRQAEKLIRRRQYVVRSNWGEVQPSAARENAFLEAHELLQLLDSTRAQKAKR